MIINEGDHTNTRPIYDCKKGYKVEDLFYHFSYKLFTYFMFNMCDNLLNYSFIFKTLVTAIVPSKNKFSVNIKIVFFTASPIT